MISFSCSHCGLKLKVKPEFAGRSSKCPTCKHPLTVPQPDRTEGHVPKGEIDGTPSSIAQAGVEGGVTLGQKSVQELLTRQNMKGQRYIIQSEIARGGMGAVLLAFDSDIRREVAIKFMLDQLDPKKKLRFIEEAQITGQLEHPNIPPVHELGLDAQKRLFFSMKMVRGRSLKEVVDVLRENPKEAEKEYTLGRLLNIFVNVCNGLAYAHSRGVIHRDLKPANIMTGDFGEVYVMDWGLAKVLKLAEAQVVGQAAPMATLASGVSSSASSAVAVSSSQSRPSSKVVTSREPEADLTQEGAIVGTPAYMPPEQAMGEIDQIDQRSDVYSLGAILYEMLTLQPPIEKEGGHLAILMRVSMGEITPPEVRVGQSSGIVTDTSQSSGTRLLSGLKTKLKQAMAETANKLRGTTKPTGPWHIPTELSSIAMKALAKEKKDRYQTVEDLRKDIERFQEGRSVSAKEDTKKEMLWKFVKRNKGFSAGVAVAFLVLIVSLVFVTKALLETRQANAIALQAEKDKDERTRKAVPALVEAARLGVEKRKFPNAMTQVDLALTYDTDNAEARLLKGQLLILEKKYMEAGTEIEKYLRQQPKDTKAAKLKDLCGRSRPDDVSNLLAIAQVFEQQESPALADGLLTPHGRNSFEARTKLLELYRKRIEKAWPGLGGRLTMDTLGIYTLNLDQCKQVINLTPLEDMPLTSLSLRDCGGVRDLTPLKGMPLSSLSLHSCVGIRDLTPLKGLPLTGLNLRDCSGVQDFTPLKGLPLTWLSLAACQVRDLTPLNGMPLTNLDLWTCGHVHDVTPLKGMPLTKLNIWVCPVTDLTPLEGMNLEEIQFTPQRVTKGMVVLRRMKSLKTIGDYSAMLPAEEFWKKYDAGGYK